MADEKTPRDAERGKRGRRPERGPATIDLKSARIADPEPSPGTPPAEPSPAEAVPPDVSSGPAPASEAAHALVETTTVEGVTGEAPLVEAVASEAVAPEAVGAEPVQGEAVPVASGETPAETATPLEAQAPAEPVPEQDLVLAAESSASPAQEAPPAAEPQPEPVPALAPAPIVRQPRPERGVPMAYGFAGGLAGGAIIVLLLAFVGPLADAPDRLTAVETAVGDKATRRTVDALDKRVATAESAAQALRTDIESLSRRPQLAPGDLAPLTQRLDRLDRAVGQLAARPAEGGGPATAPVPLPPVVIAGRESAALAVAMLLRDSVGRGTPYARELAALEASGLQPDAVAKLKPFAGEGAPTPAALAAAFAPLAVTLATPPEPPPNAGWVERLTAMAGRVVKVRPTGNAAGDEPAAIGARAEAALRRGDLAAANAALASLRGPAAATVKPFADRLAGRIAAGQAADTLVAAAVDQVIAATAQSGVPAR